MVHEDVLSKALQVKDLSGLPVGAEIFGTLLKVYSSGYSPLHVAARDGSLNRLPVGLLTASNMLFAGGVDTPLHLAARNGNLSQVPFVVLTVENMLTPCNRGRTPLHEAAGYGHLAQVPSAVITVENLLLRDKQGICPLNLACDPMDLDALLGFDFQGNAEARKILGGAWWEKNNVVVATKGKSNEVAAEVVEIEIF